MRLDERRCIPCERGVPRLSATEAGAFLAEVPTWRIENERLVRAFEFADFAGAMAFVNRMAAVAEAEGHHPDFSLHWNRVVVTVWTHAIGGLSESDFILAAKIERLAE